MHNVQERYQIDSGGIKCFNQGFLDVDPAVIASALQEKGYFSFESAITEEALAAIEKSATAKRFGLNHNDVTGVYAGRQYYFVNLLAKSKVFYDFCTSDFVFDVCRSYLGKVFRLKSLRYYETLGGYAMQWHTDNKTDKGTAQIPGLIFIFYVSDVADGEFQYIEGSHHWSGEKAYSDYSEDFISRNYADKIVSFKYPRGSLIIYNTYGIHRAKPVLDRRFIRKSVFFQVDSEITNSEPIIINPNFVENLSEDVRTYLGFGSQSEYEIFPTTNLLTLDSSQCSALHIVSILLKRWFVENARASMRRFPILRKVRASLQSGLSFARQRKAPAAKEALPE